MKKLNSNNGEGLKKALVIIHENNIATSIDTCFPDKENLKLNWTSILQNWLPDIDFFSPSIEETLLTLEPCYYNQVNSISQGKNFINYIEFEEIRKMGTKLLKMGASVILLKLGKKGLYLRTASKEKIQQIPNFFETPELVNCWSNREILFPPLKVDEIISTKGAGDTAIAGFISAISLNKNPIDSLAFSSIVAGFCIQSIDTTSKIPNYQKIENIISTGFKQEKINPTKITWKKFDNYYLGDIDAFY